MYRCLSNTIRKTAAVWLALERLRWGEIVVPMLECNIEWIYSSRVYDSLIQMCITLPGISEKMQN